MLASAGCAGVAREELWATTGVFVMMAGTMVTTGKATVAGAAGTTTGAGAGRTGAGAAAGGPHATSKLLGGVSDGALLPLLELLEALLVLLEELLSREETWEAGGGGEYGGRSLSL